MPIGAIVGTAVVGAGATAYSASKNSKAIKQAQTAQTQSDAQQIAFQREAYGNNQAALSPFMTRGNAAGDTINALLGIGGSVTVPAGTQGLPAPQNGVLAQYQGANPDTSAGMGERPYAALAGARPFEISAPFDGYPGSPLSFGSGVTQTAPQQPAQTPQQAALAAYDIFKQSTGYQSRLKEGMGALSANYFGGGVGQSGAAMKAALRYGQEFASDEFGRYLGYLGNQQGVGLSGASALAGVSQGFADRMSDISQNGANTASQAAIARAQNSGALMGGIANIAGQAVGALSSYAQPQYPPPTRTVIPAYGYG